jgi:hypothetical protein
MKTYGFPQYSTEWWAIRAGIPTASSADKIVTPTGKLSTSSEAYLNQLLAERAGYGDEPTEPTEHMLRGLALEPEARAFFELDTGLTVKQVGFITNEAGTAGCSPDGLIEIGDGREIHTVIGWEVKCPKASTHIGYLRNGILPPYYAPQVHFSMAVTGLDRWYFMSYYPGLDPLVVLVERDDYTRAVEFALQCFTERLEEEAARLGFRRAA